VLKKEGSRSDSDLNLQNYNKNYPSPTPLLNAHLSAADALDFVETSVASLTINEMNAVCFFIFNSLNALSDAESNNVVLYFGGKNHEKIFIFQKEAASLHYNLQLIVTHRYNCTC
jgi:hypothetical protein